MRPWTFAAPAALLALTLGLNPTASLAQQPTGRLASAGQVAGSGPRHVVVFLGMPGSGKSTAAELLRARLGAPTWSSGDVVRSTLRERGLAPTADNDRRVSEELGRVPGTIGHKLATEVARSGAELVVIEGFRDPRELTAFRERFPNAQVVSVEVGTARRHARQLARGRAGEDNVAFLRARDQREVNRGVRDAMRTATLRIRPRGDSMPSLERSLERMLRQVDPALAERFRNPIPQAEQ